MDGRLSVGFKVCGVGMSDVGNVAGRSGFEKTKRRESRSMGKEIEISYPVDEVVMVDDSS